MDTKLFVGNLAYETNEGELRALFAQAGTVVNVSVVKDRERERSKGFAFVEMASEAEAQKAISLFNAFKMKDRDLLVNLARPREERTTEQNRLGGGHELSRKASRPRPDPGAARIKLNAFAHGSGPTGPRRRGGAQHY